MHLEYNLYLDHMLHAVHPSKIQNAWEKDNRVESEVFCEISKSCLHCSQ